MTASKDRWPRQPFVGLTLAAIVGIASAEIAPHPSLGLIAALALAMVALFTRRSVETYGFVVAVFFFLHSQSQVSSPSVRLARELGGATEAAIVRGFVVSEPKISERNTASFLLRATSIAIHGVERLGAWHSGALARRRGLRRRGAAFRSPHAGRRSTQSGRI